MRQVVQLYLFLTTDKCRSTPTIREKAIVCLEHNKLQLEGGTVSDNRKSLRRRRAIALLNLACLGALGATTAEAQSEKRAYDSRDNLEQVIVTARRQEEDLQEVPIAITAVSQQTLQDNNVFTLSDLQHLVPSMTATSAYFNRDSVNVSIRGQGTNRFGGRPGVVSYINEVPIPLGPQSDLAGGPGLFFDLDNVAVLKGPQGTLFGRNSVGGALLLRTARPKNELGGSLQVGMGNYDSREVDGMINLPLVGDTLLARIAFNGAKRDGFTRLLGTRSNPDSSTDVDDRDFWSVRGTVTFRPGDRFENDLITTYQEYDSNGSPLLITAVNTDPAGCGGFCLFPALSPEYVQLAQQQIALGVRTAIAQSVDPESAGSNLSVNNISRIELTDTLAIRNILGYDEAKTLMAFDFDATSLPLYDGIAFPARDTLRQFTEEVQLLGKSFDQRLEWQLGAFYLRSYNPQYDGDAQTIFGVTTDTETRTTSESKAVFAQGTYDLSTFVPGLSITAGLRHTDDSSESKSRGGPMRNRCCASVTTEESSAWTWTFGLDYQVSDATLLYFASRRGYRPGGSNGIDATTLLLRPDFDPEYVSDFEVGVKSDWMLADIPIRTNAAVYYQDYSDAQVTTIYAATPDPFDVITANAAAAEQWGVEIEAQMQLTDNFRFGVNFDYLNFKYTGIGPLVDAAALEITSKTNRPPYKYGVNVRYDLPLDASVGDVSLLANWSWQDDSGDPALEFGGFIPAYGLLNLAVNWNAVAGQPLDLSLFGSNMLNKVYRTGGDGYYDKYGFDLYRFGEPRMYGLRVRYGFGAQ